LYFAHHGLGFFLLAGSDELLERFNSPRNLVLATQIKLSLALRTPVGLLGSSSNCHGSILADFAL